MKYTQIPADTLKQLQLNAGILCSSFAPSTGEVTGLIGATTGGLQFSDTPNYEDWGEDIDNCPANTKQFVHVGDRTVALSGTLLTVTGSIAKDLVGAGDLADGVITPRDYVLSSDFKDLWWVGDYSDINTGSTAGFIAIKLSNVLNTGGFQMQTEKKGKGKFAFAFTAHYDATSPDTVPYMVYVQAGTTAQASETPANPQ